VYFIDDVNLVPTGCGGEQYFVLDLPDIVHRGIGGSIDLDYIEGRTLGDFLTLGADPTGIGGRTFFTVQGFGQDSGGGSLSHSPGSCEKVRVSDPSLGKGVFKGSYDKLLSYEGFEIGGSFPVGSYFIRHDSV
jgi:hypothetical protein